MAPRRLRIAAQDVIAQAVTGSGKTAAYLLPALHRLLTQPAEAAPPPRALVLVPTRELCAQVRRPPPHAACCLAHAPLPHTRRFATKPPRWRPQRAARCVSRSFRPRALPPRR